MRKNTDCKFRTYTLTHVFLTSYICDVITMLKPTSYKKRGGI